VTHVFPLEKTKEAFETQLDSEKAIKVLIEMP
jgi:threonine dehydrogenase-like Zn-dependent dehydrogenase